jgi:hypothetical protein
VGDGIPPVVVNKYAEGDWLTGLSLNKEVEETA